MTAVPASAGFDCNVGDLIICKQFPETPLLIENIMYHGCDIIYVVRHAGCACYLLETDIVDLLSRS